MAHLRSPILLLIAVVLAGCYGDQNTSQSNTNQDAAYWTITELRADQGHDTIEAEDGGMYHNNFCAVVLKKDDESINLLYENALPENLDLMVGNHYHIDGLDDATYSDNWHGYWLHNVRLRRIKSK